MRTLYLLRHAKSSLQDETIRDFDRPLTKRGREAAEVVGQEVAAERLNNALVLSSPAIRARETTEIMLQSSKLPAELRFDPQIYEADLSALLKILGQSMFFACCFVISMKFQVLFWRTNISSSC